MCIQKIFYKFDCIYFKTSLLLYFQQINYSKHTLVHQKLFTIINYSYLLTSSMETRSLLPGGVESCARTWYHLVPLAFKHRLELRRHFTRSNSLVLWGEMRTSLLVVELIDPWVLLPGCLNNFVKLYHKNWLRKYIRKKVKVTAFKP